MKKVIKKIVICIVVLYVLLDIWDFEEEPVSSTSSTKTDIQYIENKKQLAKAVHDATLHWKKSFTIGYKGSCDEIFSGNLEKLFDNALAIDNKNTSDDFDYMNGTIDKYAVEMIENSKGTKLKFSVTYRETWQQHKKVDQFVKSALSKLNLEGKSDYAKAKAIHDYIINRVTYDESGTKYSAYSAAIKKRAVCQGYALLFYKMATEAGLHARCVESSDHEWNIVKIGAKWYHVDTTWDDPVGSEPMLEYDYFMKGSRAMARTHKMLKKYRTKAFKAKYPISGMDYR